MLLPEAGLGTWDHTRKILSRRERFLLSAGLQRKLVIVGCQEHIESCASFCGEGRAACCARGVKDQVAVRHGSH